MRHLTLWTLILLVLWAVPSCSRTEDEHTATIVIGEGGSFLFQSGQFQPVAYESGDTVLVELEGDTCYISGQPYWPPPYVPPEVWPVEMLREFYGNVPSVLEYVHTHTGDETELWNQASRQWQEKKQLLMREILRRYQSDLQNGKAADEAVESALVTVGASSLVASARLDSTLDSPGSPQRTIFVQWAGQTDEVLFWLDPHAPLYPTRPRPMTLERFKDFVSMLRLLEHSSPAAIELLGGSLKVSSGAKAQRTTTEQ
jgi:hypothetical protein